MDILAWERVRIDIQITEIHANDNTGVSDDHSVVLMMVVVMLVMLLLLMLLVVLIIVIMIKAVGL